MSHKSVTLVDNGSARGSFYSVSLTHPATNESQMPNIRSEISTPVITDTTAAKTEHSLMSRSSNTSEAYDSESILFTSGSSSSQMVVAFGSSAAIISSTSETYSGNLSTHSASVYLNYTNSTAMGVTTSSSVANFSSPLTSFVSDSSYSTPFNTSSGIVTVWTSASTPTVQTKMEEVGLLNLPLGDFFTFNF